MTKFNIFWSAESNIAVFKRNKMTNAERFQNTFYLYTDIKKGHKRVW